MMGGEGSRYVPRSWGCFVKIKHEHFPPWELAGPKCSASLCLPVLLPLYKKGTGFPSLVPGNGFCTCWEAGCLL